MEPISKRLRISQIADEEKRLQVETILQEFVYDADTVQRVIDTFESEIKLATSPDEDKRKQTDLFWENTFVRKLLDGTENGTYLGLDLGGTNFRIVMVDLTNGEATTETKYYVLEKHLLNAPCAGIFDYIASCMQTFLNEGSFEKDKTLPVGFTFSFPSFQTSLKCCTLQTWTKSITCPDGHGLDPVTLLEEAITRQGGLPVPVDIVARISDTTGTFLAGDLADKQCRIGLIVGTGSNAAFVEYTKNIERWETSFKDNEKSDIVVINTEFGAFGDNGCINFMKNDIDREVDKYSNHPGSYSFEKLYSGMYLGEVVRLTLVKMTKQGLLFDGKGSDKLFERWSLTSSQVSTIERDEGGDTTNTLKVLDELDLKAVASEDDIALTRDVCDVLSQRGAYAVATAMVVLLNHIDLPEVTIAVDGSLYEHHPKYHKHMMDLISKWRPATKTKLILVKDGSGQGAALVAAIARKMHS